MIPAAFAYHAPKSLREAVRLLREYEGEARVVSGGMSLIPAMKLRLVQPEHLVDIGRLDELSYVQRAGDGLRIGAATTYRDIEKSRAVESVAPLLTETARVVGDLQVRNKGTIGGAAAHADPAADVPAALLALEARLRVVGGRRSRVIPAHRFFVDAYETVLGPTEVLTEVEIPKMPPRTGWAYVKFANKASRFAIVGVAALLTLDRKGGVTRARIAVTGAGPRPVRAQGERTAADGTLRIERRYRGRRGQSLARDGVPLGHPWLRGVPRASDGSHHEACARNGSGARRHRVVGASMHVGA